MKRWGAICVALVVALAGQVARAEDDRVPEAQRRFEAGMASYHLEEYDKAIEEWEAGYRVKPAPQFLYNIAQAYRMSKRPERALSFYQKYLKLAPKAANHAEVERHIKALTAIVQSQREAEQRPSTQPLPLGKSEPAGTATTATTATGPATTPPATATSAAPSSATPASATSAAPSSATTAESTPARADLTSTAPARDKPVYKKGWFWGVVVGGAVVVAGAVTLGVLLTRPAAEQPLPVAQF